METGLVDGVERELGAQIVRVSSGDWKKLEDLRKREKRFDNWLQGSVALTMLIGLPGSLLLSALIPIEVLARTEPLVIFSLAALCLTPLFILMLVMMSKSVVARNDLKKFKTECAYRHNVADGEEYKLLPA